MFQNKSMIFCNNVITAFIWVIYNGRYIFQQFLFNIYIFAHQQQWYFIEDVKTRNMLRISLSLCHLNLSCQILCYTTVQKESFLRIFLYT